MVQNNKNHEEVRSRSMTRSGIDVRYLKIKIKIQSLMRLRRFCASDSQEWNRQREGGRARPPP